MLKQLLNGTGMFGRSLQWRARATLGTPPRTRVPIIALLCVLLLGSLADAQIRTAGTRVQAGQKAAAGITPNTVSGGTITLSMTGPTSLSIDITSRMGTALNPLNNTNPISLTATYGNVSCTPVLTCLFVAPPTLYLYAYVPSAGLVGPGGYSIPASALQASTTTSNFVTFATQSYGTSPPVTPAGPSFLISQSQIWHNGTATGTLYLNLNLTGVTSLPAGSYTGVVTIRASITQ